ncbi:MAG: hypothetical protein K6E91_00905 [Butyrivibrio sp.]|nr:hypothetical protein [Butyrivibrio sp.]
MKKFLAMSLVCAFAVSSFGCGAGNNGGDAQQTPGLESIEEKLDTSADKAEDSKEGVDETKKDAEAPGQETGGAGQESGAADTALYEDFKKGNAKVRYRGTADLASNIPTTQLLEVGKSYTMDEIVALIEKSDEYRDLKLSSDIIYREIDCGSDGVPELLAEASFGDEFTLFMIIKEIDGELVMCFDQDSWSRSSIVVNANGTIEGSGSGGAAIHVADYAFVDASGDYKYYYGCEETLTLYGDIYAYKTAEDYVVIPSEGLDNDHLGIRDYYFEADYDKRNHYYEYFVIDDNYNDVTTDADYDDSNELKKKFTEAGIRTYTKAEMDQMLKDRAKEIGYPKP